MFFVLCPYYNIVLEWLRRNFVGWLPIFFIGIWYANTNYQIKFPSNKLILLLFSAIMLIAICLMNLNFYAWLFAQFFALIFFALIGKLSYNVRVLKQIFLWLGKYSALIFVSQTIARGFSRRLFENTSIFIMVLAYILLTMIISMGYKYLYDKLLKIAKIK